jgi:hypothetical protein
MGMRAQIARRGTPLGATYGYLEPSVDVARIASGVIMRPVARWVWRERHALCLLMRALCQSRLVWRNSWIKEQ